ncbi:MAG: super-infection exclusion protein B [Sulfuricaulis sp.]
MIDVVSFLGWLKEIVSRPAGVAMTAALSSAFILFMPPSVMEPLGLAQLRDQYKGPIGAVLVVSLATLVVIAILRLTSWVKAHVENRRQRRRMEKSLGTLTIPEKGLLIYFIGPQTRVKQINALVPEAQSLIDRGILYRPSQIATGLNFTYCIHEWAWEYLNKHRELLSLDGKTIPE